MTKFINKDNNSRRDSIGNPKVSVAKSSIIDNNNLSISQDKDEQSVEIDTTGLMSVGSIYFDMQDEFMLDVIKNDDILSKFKLYETKLKELSYILTK